MTKNLKENTIESFENAFNNGFLGIEFDVRKTKDEKLVVLHDAHIDRVSNGRGLVRNLKYDELLQYNFGSDIVVSKIPLLEEVLLKYRGKMKLVELKVRIDLDDILDYIDDDTYFISFDTSYILGLKKKYPQIKCGILNYVLNSIEDYNLDIICLLETVATEDIIMKFLKKGIKVFIYGIIGNVKKSDFINLYYIVDKKY